MSDCFGTLVANTTVTSKLWGEEVVKLEYIGSLSLILYICFYNPRLLQRQMCPSALQWHASWDYQAHCVRKIAVFPRCFWTTALSGWRNSIFVHIWWVKESSTENSSTEQCICETKGTGCISMPERLEEWGEWHSSYICAKWVVEYMNLAIVACSTVRSRVSGAT